MRGTTTRFLRRGLALEYATLGWNVVGIVVLAVAAIAARSVALAGFGLDSPRQCIDDRFENAHGFMMPEPRTDR
jgi:hypothetical protein